MSANTIIPFAGLLALSLADCSTCGLDPLFLEGTELHPSPTTCDLDTHPIRHIVPVSVLSSNLQHSTEEEFVQGSATRKLDHTTELES